MQEIVRCESRSQHGQQCNKQKNHAGQHYAKGESWFDEPWLTVPVPLVAVLRDSAPRFCFLAMGIRMAEGEFFAVADLGVVRARAVRVTCDFDRETIGDLINWFLRFETIRDAVSMLRLKNWEPYELPRELVPEGWSVVPVEQIRRSQ